MDPGSDEAQRLKRLENVYAAGDRRALDASYELWANDYDRDVMAMGYASPAVVAAMAAKHVASDASLLDAGCGTGLLALLLRALGYRQITGIDMNETMLAIARARGLYADCHVMVLGERLDFADARFAAAVASGVFTAGHAPPEAFAELRRIVAAGGMIVLGLRADGEVGAAYREACDRAEALGAWRLIEASQVFQAFPLSREEAHVTNVVRVYRTV
jgi:SAM-dependent methyltransferase